MAVQRIFLSHNSKDKAKVRRIARRLLDDPELKRLGWEVFWDEWHLIPGNDLINELEEALKDTCVAVCFQGPHGEGPYQSEEVRTILRRSIKGRCRVVPVLLRGADEKLLDGFLGNRLAVKYGGPGAYDRLVSGILNRAPGAPRPRPSKAPRKKRSVTKKAKASQKSRPKA